jgi:glycosyltransferase involved in cell wall biosynthesis
MDDITVTIVIPSFNHAPYLKEALESVVVQTYRPLEVIVMDGGSTDGSVDVIQRYASSIHYWQSCPDGGQASALAAGFAKSTGSILGWLNSDDRLENVRAIELLVEIFRNNSHVGWIFGNSVVIDTAGSVLYRRSMPQVGRRELVNLSVHLPQESTYFRRTLYLASGGIDPTYELAMDYDFWLRLSRISEPRHEDILIGAFRKVSGQKSADRALYQAEVARAKMDHADANLSALRRSILFVSYIVKLTRARRRDGNTLGLLRTAMRRTTKRILGTSINK